MVTFKAWSAKPEHGKIVDAILCGDGHAAAVAAYGHVSIVGAASIVFAKASDSE
jgi:DNA-binding FadR family transcriptional regulator